MEVRWLLTNRKHGGKTKSVSVLKAALKKRRDGEKTERRLLMIEREEETEKKYPNHYERKRFPKGRLWSTMRRFPFFIVTAAFQTTSQDTCAFYTVICSNKCLPTSKSAYLRVITKFNELKA